MIKMYKKETLFELDNSGGISQDKCSKGRDYSTERIVGN